MLKGKKYNNLKNKGFNKFFKRHDDNIDYCETNNHIIKQSLTFDIIKEKILGTYILCFKNIIIIHLEENEYKDFVYLYKNSNKYSFDIYSTVNYNSNIIYHIFCTNKYIDVDINYSNFLNGNECEYKYKCLTKYYGPCLVINRRFSMNEMFDKINSKYIFVKLIGKNQNINQLIKNFIKKMITLINTYYIENLPLNYLNI